MNIKSIINQCIALNIKLSVENDNLKVGAPKGVMTQPLLTAIKENKTELLAFLNDYLPNRQKERLPRVFPKVKEAELSAGQNQMWFLDNAMQTNDAYQFYRILHIEGEVDVPVLRQVVAKIVERHSILRTTYHETPNGSVQRIGDGSGFVIEYLDLSSNIDAEMGANIDATSGQFKQSRIDLSSDLMLKALLVKTAVGRYQLHIKFHHIATDGWSIGLIVKELTEFYNAMINDVTLKTDVSFQYIDYAKWQQSEPAKRLIAKNLKFFKNY
ncbi:MAG: condensation domain-containing protein, partial [Psychrosphaera sp.]|nr:condensation domain-containing protein [Psychrosphaera sp.]